MIAYRFRAKTKKCSDFSHNVLSDNDGLWSTKATEGSIGDDVGLADVSRYFQIGNVVKVVHRQQTPLHHLEVKSEK